MTVQRYDSGIAVYESGTKNFRFFLDSGQGRSEEDAVILVISQNSQNRFEGVKMPHYI